jgi:hypothetical protein
LGPDDNSQGFIKKQLYTKRIKEPSEGGIETARRSKVEVTQGNKFNSEDYE